MEEKAAETWPRVVSALQEKHRGAPVVHFTSATLAGVSLPLARYAVVVCGWQDAGDRPLLRRLHRRLRAVVWGMVTASDEAQALKLVTDTAQPLSVQRVLSGTEDVDVRRFSQLSTAFSELRPGTAVEGCAGSVTRLAPFDRRDAPFLVSRILAEVRFLLIKYISLF